MGRVEVDWVVIRVHTVRRLLVVAAVIIVTAGLVAFAYSRLNPPPDVAARRKVGKARAAWEEVQAGEISETWAGDIAEGQAKLEEASGYYAEEKWPEAIAAANDAIERFKAPLGRGNAGVGSIETFEGRVTVQRAGMVEWKDAHKGMPVFNGDFVKCGRDGSAEILFRDSTVYRVLPGSLLQINHVEEADKSVGTIKFGRAKVITGSSSSTVITENTETDVDSDSDVVVKVNESDQQTVVRAIDGGARVKNSSGQEIALGKNEQVVGRVDGSLGEKSTIPSAPVPVTPANNRAFELDKQIELTWRSEEENVAGVHLQISRASRFSENNLIINEPRFRKKTARLKGRTTGLYYWRIATVDRESVTSEWSPPRCFRVEAKAQNVPGLKDTKAPMLIVEPEQQHGHVFIVEGLTDVGARVTVNGEPVELDGEGRFRRTVNVTTVGKSKLIILATDSYGNTKRVSREVLVEE